MDGINLLVDKLSRYNLVTNILPGSVLFIILKYYIGYSFRGVMQEWFLVGIHSAAKLHKYLMDLAVYGTDIHPNDSNCIHNKIAIR